MNELDRKIGKFDSPESLLKAYESLQSEFTKRSQRLKESEKEIARLKEELSDNARLDNHAAELLNNEDYIRENVLNKQDIRKMIIEDYLMLISGAEGTKLLGSAVGKSALTPPSRPTTLSEAKRLAERIING